MPPRRHCPLLATAFTALALTFSSHAQELDSSTLNLAEHTPGYRLMALASRSYEAGQYWSAFTKYREAARWADKFAQFNLGVMHLKGQGTEYDPARALAWFQLSAERGYPMMVAMVDDLTALLDEETIDRATRIRISELEPVFGDAYAVERTHRRMRRERRYAAGTRVGYIGLMRVIDRDGFSRDGYEFFAREKWDFRNVVDMETQYMMGLGDGRVELRELELNDD